VGPRGSALFLEISWRRIVGVYPLAVIALGLASTPERAEAAAEVGEHDAAGIVCLCCEGFDVVGVCLQAQQQSVEGHAIQAAAPPGPDLVNARRELAMVADAGDELLMPGFRLACVAQPVVDRRRTSSGRVVVEPRLE
jgi:hypothetical protein